MGFLAKDRLFFDAADLTVSDRVGANLIGADDTVLGNVSDALKVNIQNASVVVSATDLDIRDIDFATDSIDVSGSSVSITGSVTVTASDLDIRDLTHATDSIKIGDGTDFLEINADGSINVNLTDDGIADDAADAGNPLKVGGHAYASALSAVSAGDRVNMGFDLYRRIRTFMGAQVGINTPAVVTVGTSEVALPASPLAGRQKIIVQNTSDKDIFVGESGLTTATGIRVAKGATLELDIGEIALYAIAGSAGNNVRILEIA
jgi:hypothetical protein